VKAAEPDRAPDTVRCVTCDGTGRRALSAAEAATFAAIGEDWTTTGAIAEALPRVKKSALLMRLRRLVVLGAVEVRVSPVHVGARQWRRTP
jgi:hypothetical protein